MVTAADDNSGAQTGIPSSEGQEIHQDLRDYLEVLIADRLEQRMLDRENKRFRMMYIVFAVVTAIGLGVFLNQISISADSAVEKRLGETLDQTEEFREFTKLLLVGTQLDVKNTFTDTQRDEATALAISLYQKPNIASDKSYIAIVESIVDALAASGNARQILAICRNTKTLCTDNEGIAITVLTTFGKKVLSSRSTHDATKDERDLFESAVSSLKDSGSYQGNAWAYTILADFNDGLDDRKIEEKLNSISSSSEDVRGGFNKSIEVLSDRTKMSDDPSPEMIAVEALARRFVGKFGESLPGNVRDSS